MEKVKKTIDDNCIHNPTSCTDWNGGDIEYLGICDGAPLNTLMWEVINKLKAITGTDLSTFDIDSLLAICNQTAPTEVTIISILTLIRNNQVCLKDFIDSLNDRLLSLNSASGANVNLKCYADLDNQGNALAITRDQLDQLIIDNLCNQKSRIGTLEGKVTDLQSQINNVQTTFTVQEPSISTCIDAAPKSTSLQVQSVANALCSLEVSAGTPIDISSALSKTPSTFNTDFSLITGWDLTPGNLAENYGNLLLAFNNVVTRLKFLETTCCAITCKDIELGFSAVFNESNDAIIIRFTSGAGTFIPAGVTDKGSTGVITDKNGDTETFALVLTNNYEIDVPISGLDLSDTLQVDITAKVGTPSLTCEKCLTRKVASSSCGFCEISAVGHGDGTEQAIIIYSDDSTVILVVPTPLTSTTTTTTAGV